MERDLLNLLPTIYRLRDRELAGLRGPALSAAEAAELAVLESQATTLDGDGWRRLEDLRTKASRGPLAALLAILGEQLDILGDDLDQLYDDHFVETVSSWALPYIGDLIGYRALHGRAPGITARAEIGHTIGYRRRKGTASMLEQLARDVTGWDARVVESFALLATTQYMNHRRLGNQVTPNLRAGGPLEFVGTAFDGLPRTLDVRRIEGGRGRHNIPNIGIFLWRLRPLAVTSSPAVPDPTDAAGRRFRFSPLGDDIALLTRPLREDEIEHLAEPVNVPFPISRRRLELDLIAKVPELYGDDLSLAVSIGGAEVPAAGLAVCNLSDVGAGWAHEPPAGRIGIDPELGRLVVAADLLPLAGELRVSFHHGGPDGIGGGDYARAPSFANPAGPIVRVPTDVATIQAGIDAVVGTGGVVEIEDNGRYTEALSIDVAAGASIEVRAANETRPTIELTAEWRLRGGAGSRIFLNGLLVLGDRLVARGAANQLAELHVRHCTLVPGLRIDASRAPASPGASSVRVAIPGVRLSVCASIVGGLRVDRASETELDGSVVDAGREGVAYGVSDTSPTAPGGALTLESSTLVGDVHARRLEASNGILVGRTVIELKQEGCLRFSSVGPGSETPRGFRCQPALGPGDGQVPHFASLSFGAPAYARLADGTPPGIATGSEDESEMGVYRRRYEPQRHADLRTRLDEYLRLGLEAGVIHES